VKHVFHVVGALTAGGAQSRLLDLLRRARPDAIRFTFGCFDGHTGDLAGEAERLGAHVVEIGPRKHPLIVRHRLRRILETRPSDAVHAHLHFYSGLCVESAFRARVPQRIVHVRAGGDGRSDTLPRRAYRRAMRHLINKYATDLVAVSHSARDAFGGSDEPGSGKWSVVYNGFEFSKFNRDHRESVRTELGIKPLDPVVIHVGRFVPEKNQRGLLAIAKMVNSALPSTTWIFVGDGPLRRDIEADCATMGLWSRARFVGTRDDVPRLLGAADAFVFPSLFEGLPGAVVEALATGLPVIASDIPGVREIAERCGGIALRPLDEFEQFAQETLRALDSPWRYPVRRAALLETFSMERHLRSLGELYGAPEGFDA
jgi:glycosyltransferase involved in cell wall biosynthesis